MMWYRIAGAWIGWQAGGMRVGLRSSGGEAQTHRCFVEWLEKIDVLNRESEFYIIPGWKVWCWKRPQDGLDAELRRGKLKRV